MVHKIGQAIPFSFLLKDTDGVPVIGKAPTYTIIDELNNASAPALAVEDSGGRYLGTLTPDASGTWKIQVDCNDPVAHEEYNLFVGVGLEQDIDDYLDTEIAAIKLKTDLIVTGGATEANVTTAVNDIAAVHVHAGTIEQDTNELQTDWVNGGRLDLLLDSAVTGATRVARYQHKDIYWSPPQLSVTADTSHTDASLPSVVLPNITGTILHVYAGVKFRMISNSYAGVNKLSGAQEIQVKENAAGAWTDAINLVDDLFTLASSIREGGDVIMGNIDLIAEVAAFNKTYAFQWDEPLTDQNSIILHDVQTFLIVTWY